MGPFWPCLQSRIWIWSPDLIVLDSSCLTRALPDWLSVTALPAERLKALGLTLLLVQGLGVRVVATGLLL